MQPQHETHRSDDALSLLESFIREATTVAAFLPKKEKCRRGYESRRSRPRYPKPLIQSEVAISLAIQARDVAKFQAFAQEKFAHSQAIAQWKAYHPNLRRFIREKPAAAAPVPVVHHQPAPSLSHSRRRALFFKTTLRKRRRATVQRRIAKRKEFNRRRANKQAMNDLLAAIEADVALKKSTGATVDASIFAGSLQRIAKAGIPIPDNLFPSEVKSTMHTLSNKGVTVAYPKSADEIYGKCSCRSNYRARVDAANTSWAQSSLTGRSTYTPSFAKCESCERKKMVAKKKESDALYQHMKTAEGQAEILSRSNFGYFE